MALRLGTDAGWSATQYFLSFAPHGSGRGHPRDLLSPGFVYVLSIDGFRQMPPYDWPGLGRVLEPHWVHPHAMEPLWSLPVTPADFSLPVCRHDAAQVDRQAEADPWGFSCLTEEHYRKWHPMT